MDFISTTNKYLVSANYIYYPIDKSIEKYNILVMHREKKKLKTSSLTIINPIECQSSY